MRRFHVFLALLAAGCSSQSISLAGRPCSTSDDCVAGYVCTAGVCTEGSGSIDDDDPPPQLDERLTLGAKFTVNAGETPLTDFPVLMYLEGYRLNRGLIREDGSNLRIVDAETGLTIPFDLAVWNPTALSQLHIMLDQIDGTRRLALAYGDDSVTAPTDKGWAERGFTAVYHFEVGTPEVDSSGVTGTLTGALNLNSSPQNSIFVPNANESAQVVRQIDDLTSLTIELRALSADAAFTYRRDVTLSSATTVDGYQVPVSFGPRGQRVAAVGSAQAPLWTEERADGTVHWVRIPAAGTSAFAFYDDGVTDVVEAGFSVVMDAGIGFKRWSNVSLPSNGDAPVYQTVNGLTGAASSFGSARMIQCPGECAFGTGDNFVVIASAWWTPVLADLCIGTTSDDSSDFAVGPDAWELNEPAAHVYHYSAADTNAVTAYIGRPAAVPVRLRYRYIQGSGNTEYFATSRVYGTVTGCSQFKSNVINSTADAPVFRHQKQVAVPSTGTASPPIVLGETLRDAGDLSINITPTIGHIKIGGIVLEAPIDRDSGHTYALTLDGRNATLFVDGVAQATGTLTQDLNAAGGRQLRIGDVQGDAFSPPSGMDELRYSRAARPPEWIAAQYANRTGGFITFD